jgi:hypothetical protein
MVATLALPLFQRYHAAATTAKCKSELAELGLRPVAGGSGDDDALELEVTGETPPADDPNAQRSHPPPTRLPSPTPPTTATS